jgi:hypothetical protein
VRTSGLVNNLGGDRGYDLGWATHKRRALVLASGIKMMGTGANSLNFKRTNNRRKKTTTPS